MFGVEKLLRQDKCFLLAYDQGFEHGPTDFDDRNADPQFVFDIASESGVFTCMAVQKGIAEKYYDKEIIERAFKQMKGILNLRPIRVWLKNHVEGHIRICYLAYAILSLMNYKLRKLKISSIDALNSLKHGYKVNLRSDKDNFEWSLYVPLEPKQKKMLQALGVVYKN